MLFCAAFLGACATTTNKTVAEKPARHDRHAGYYYPPPQTTEIYKARARVLPESNRERRLAFVTALTQRIARRPFPPRFAIFAKGEVAEKLIITATQADTYNTIYRARALFASLTAMARLTPLFRDFRVEYTFTFFDLAMLLGFEQITISDGDRFAHQVRLE